MSVEAASPVIEPAAPTESEVVRLLREQNAILRGLAASLRPKTEESNWLKVKAIAATIPATDEVRFVAVDPTTGAHATGRTSREASRALGTPFGRNYITGAGGKAVRVQTTPVGGR